MYQQMFDWLLTHPTNGFNKAIYRAGMAVYKAMTIISNPLVMYTLDGVKMEFPASHKTPFMWKFDPDYSKSLGRVARACSHKYLSSVIVDLGANVGDSAAIIRAAGVKNRIVSIEGARGFYEVLELNAQILGEVTPVHAFIGAKNHLANAKIHVLKSGNAVVYERPEDYKKESAAVTPIAATEVRFSTLEEIVEGEQVKLLKTDIEGYDLPVLQNSLDFIAKNKPVIFMELHVSGVDERSKRVGWRDLWGALHEIGYRKALYWRNSSDFLCMLDMASTATEDVHSYLRNREGLIFADVCLVHEIDIDLAETIRSLELEKARTIRPDPT